VEEVQVASQLFSRTLALSRARDWLAPVIGMDALAHPKSTTLRRHAWLLALLAGVAIVLVLPTRFPSGVNTFGSVTSMHKWVLARGSDGQLIANSFNYQTGLSEGYRVTNFTAGSSVFCSLRPSLAPGQQVTVGDTIGSIYSSETQERLVTLQGELAQARSLLAVNATGQKSAVVEEARQRLEFARKKLEDHKTIMTRTQRLFESSLIAQDDYDIVKNQESALQSEIKIAEASLQAARTGAKPEQLDLSQSHIAALQSEIAAIQNRAATYTLTAPISGVIYSGTGPDTLLTIADTSTYIALIAVRRSDYGRVAAVPDARVALSGFSRPISGHITALNRQMQQLHGQEVFLATAVLDDTPDDLMPGVLAKCRIECKPVTALEFCKRMTGAVVTANQVPRGR
jgi:hypothetical protein